MPTPSIKFTTRVYVLEYLKGVHYLEVPASVVKKLRGLKHRLLCTVNKITWQCGLVALGEGRAYITLSKKIMTQAGMKAGQQVNVSVKKDESEYGMTMPDELKEFLDQDPEGMKRYKGLKPGMQRYIIYYVRQVKSSQLRIDRAIKLIENLKKLPKGKETYRGLFGVPPAKR